MIASPPTPNPQQVGLSRLVCGTPAPNDCELYYVDKDALFSYHTLSEVSQSSTKLEGIVALGINVSACDRAVPMYLAHFRKTGYSPSCLGQGTAYPICLHQGTHPLLPVEN